MRLRDRLLERYYQGLAPRPRYVPPDLAKRLIGKLDLLQAASTLDDLRIPPSNRLERLSGDRKGMYSIRVNDQWRLVFTWSVEGADDVEFTDYH